MNSPKRRLRELLQRRLDPVYYEIVNDDNLELLLKKGCIGEAQLVLVTEKELAAPPGDALPALLIGAIKNTFRETRPPPPAADSSAQPETSLSAGQRWDTPCDCCEICPLSTAAQLLSP